MTLYRDPVLLYRRYVADGMSQREIAKELGCSHSTISKWMKKHGIPARSTSEGMILYRRGKSMPVNTSGSPTC